MRRLQVKDIDTIVPRSDAMVFCTCAEINQAKYLEKVKQWYAYVHEHVDADLYVINDGKLLSTNESVDLGDVTFVEFPMVAGRQSITAFPGWKRSFAASLKISEKYKYYGHIENDCFIKDINGFNTLLHTPGIVSTGWCIEHAFVEFTAAIINNSEIRRSLYSFYSDINNQRRAENFEDQVLPFLKGWRSLGDSVRLEQGHTDNLDYDIVSQTDKLFPRLVDYYSKPKDLVFNHSGKMGDLLYSLCYCKEYAEAKGLDKFSVNIQTDQYDGKDIRFSQKTAEWLRPLLLSQPYINNVTISKTVPEFSYNLDVFRSCGLNLNAGDIRCWYYRLKPNALPKLFLAPILQAPTDPQYKDKIVLCRTTRHRNKKFTYKKLESLKDEILFVGAPEEHRIFCQDFFKCEYKPVNDALELATVINSAKLFIGNQSGSFAMAEQLKTPRLLETAEHHPCSFPNVLPIGGKCFAMLTSPTISMVRNVSR